MSILLAIPFAVYCGIIAVGVASWFAYLMIRPMLDQWQRDEIADYESDFKHVDRVVLTATQVRTGRARVSPLGITPRPRSQQEQAR